MAQYRPSDTGVRIGGGGPGRLHPDGAGQSLRRDAGQCHHRAGREFQILPQAGVSPQALAAKVEGTVTLAFLVRADGTVREAVVRKTSGNASLDEKARAALAKCRFQPGTVNGAPKEQWTELKYTWAPE